MWTPLSGAVLYDLGLEVLLLTDNSVLPRLVPQFGGKNVKMC